VRTDLAPPGRKKRALDLRLVVNYVARTPLRSRKGGDSELATRLSFADASVGNRAPYQSIGGARKISRRDARVPAFAKTAKVGQPPVRNQRSPQILRTWKKPHRSARIGIQHGFPLTLTFRFPSEFMTRFLPHLLAISFALNTAHAQTFKALYDFKNGADGGIPISTVVRDQTGNLYGTAYQGGDIDNCNPPQGCGTVFKVSPAGKETVLYAFQATSDGSNPAGGVIRDSVGSLYGATVLGGTSNMGTVFKVDKAGKESVLYNFTGGTDGGSPVGVIMDANGNLYGITEIGGDLSCELNGMYGCGAVFKLTPAGKLAVLHRFHGNDGADPSAPLVRDESGNLYGTTIAGGGGAGVVFKVSEAGQFTVLHAFQGGDGADPGSGLVRDKSGNLYGTTYAGGIFGSGTVFEVSNTRKERVLYNFTFGADGGRPLGGLVRDPAGNFYGTTSLGGDLSCNNGSGCGTVFKLTATGKETALYNFEDKSDGGFPEQTLLLDSSGNLYGTTPGNFQFTWGSVFKLTP
jgi:uncharacterized repeat protein (TIGR03803 family)